MFGSTLLGALRHRIGSASRWAAENSLALRRMAVAVAALAALCTLIGTLLYQSHLDIATGAVTAASNIATAVSADEARNFELLDLSLQGIRDAVVDPEVATSNPRLQRLILFDRTLSATDIEGLFVLDRDGNIVIDSRSAVSRVHRFGSSDFFRAHSHQKDRGLFISRPFLSPFDGEWSIALSRRLERPDGSFSGVVVGVVKLAYFDKLFKPLDVGTHGSVTLLGFDGAIFMHHPYDDGQIGRVLNIANLMSKMELSTTGSYEAISPLDGVRRLYHYQQVGSLPLVQIVGFATDDLYRPWRQKAAVVIGVMIMFCGAIMGLVFYLQRELGKRIAAENAYARLAATDKLTGLPNRRKFDEVLEAEWQRSRRSGVPLSLLMIDVDHFKGYNDEYGHLGGDAALALLGQTLTDGSIRTTDFVARFGGEEFVIILPNSGEPAAACVAERIRARVETLQEPHRASPIGIISVSVGAATMLPDDDGRTASHLIEAADVALYRAKAAGRNRVQISKFETFKNAA